jgi:hypothetical protein
MQQCTINDEDTNSDPDPEQGFGDHKSNEIFLVVKTGKFLF